MSFGAAIYTRWMTRQYKTVAIETGYSENGGSKKRTKNHLKANNCLCPWFKLSSPDQCTCSIVAFRPTLGEMKLLLHLLSLITKIRPKGKLVL